MKINWFSPLPEEQTGIADFTMLLLVHIYTLVDVVIWTPHHTSYISLEKFGSIRFYDPLHPPFRELNKADMTFYNLGNDFNFHNEIWNVLQAYPGIVILHDTNLFDFFVAYYHRKTNGKIEFIEILRKYYGNNVINDVTNYWKGVVEHEFMVNKYPLTELAVENAKGIIIHNITKFNQLKDKFMLPCYYLPLPNKPSNLSLKKLTNEATYNLIIFGYIGTNRRIDSILKAFSESEYKDFFRLSIIGRLWDKDYVSLLINKFNLQDKVNVLGFISEEQLHQELIKADFAFNLRYPSMGEASSCQLKIWEYSLPSMVTMIDDYINLPTEAVVHISLENELEDIKNTLADFIKHRDKYLQMGEAGRKILNIFHRPEVYARLLLGIATDLPTYPFPARMMLKRCANACKDFYVANYSQRVSSAIVDLLSPPGTV